MVDYAVRFVMNVCVEKKKRARARPAEIWFCGCVVTPERQACGRRECVRAGLAGLILLTFPTGASLLLPSNIIRCSSDPVSTLLSTSVAEEQDAR